MAQTERKQVGKVGDLVKDQVSQVATKTQPINGAVHGLVKDLTVNGTGFAS